MLNFVYRVNCNIHVLTLSLGNCIRGGGGGVPLPRRTIPFGDTRTCMEVLEVNDVCGMRTDCPARRHVQYWVSAGRLVHCRSLPLIVCQRYYVVYNRDFF